MVSERRSFGALFAEPTKNGLTRPKAVRGEGVKMVNMGELFAYPRISNAPMDRVPLSKSESERFLLKEGDLLFARQSLVLEGAGKCSIFLRDDEPVTFESHVTRVRLDPRKADPIFYFYYLQSHHGRAAIRSIVEQGAGASGIRGSDLQALEVLWYPLLEQRAIAHILGTLDDKIELNRRMNETLEAIARTLFKSWFVDFDPVRAKAEGRDPGLPEPLSALFPNSFDDSELGKIPRGWVVGCVDDEFELTMGQSPPGNTYNEVGDGLPFYQGRTDFGSRFPTRRVHCTAPTRLAKKGDTLISVRAPVGDINMAAEDCAIGRGVAAARHRTGSRSYSYQFMRSQEEVFDRFEAEGTVFGSIGKRDFHAISCVIPPRNVIVEFERRLAPIDDRIEVAHHEVSALAALRDTLLPKLICGDIRLEDSGRFLAGAD